MRAFVLSGGGSKGAFQVGVLRQLDTKGIRPDALYGTSTGAVNAAALAFAGLETLEAVWKNLRGVGDLFEMRPWLTLPFDLLGGRGNGIYRTGPLWKLIREKITGAPRVPVTVTRVNLRTTELVFDRSSPEAPDTAAFQKAVLASASTPLLMDLVDGKWADGGLRDITPLKRAIRDGADEIVAVLCDPYPRNFTGPTTPVGNVVDIAKKTVAVMTQEIFWEDVKTAVRYNENPPPGKRKIPLAVYAPSEVLEDSFNFDPSNILKNTGKGAMALPVFISGK